ncbi:MAG: hypothetical protein U0X91_28455 [Spirosomataceae bacterium]
MILKENSGQINPGSILKFMVGRDLAKQARQSAVQPEVLLEVRGL